MQNKKALCFICDKKFYDIKGKHAILSAKKHNPDYKIVLLSDGVEDKDIIDYSISYNSLYLNPRWWLFSGRPAIIKYTLQNLKFDFCILIDGDTYTYNSYKDFEKEFIDGASIIVTPHLLKPLPTDNRNPQMKQINLMGNYNAGIIGASKIGIEFISWLTDQTAVYPEVRPNEGLAAEQGWLRYALDFDDKARVFRHPGYNVAYWNIGQRNIEYKNDNWVCNGKDLVIMHFSGLTENVLPENMSVHQNRYMLEKNEPAYMLYKNYKQLIWGI